MSNKILEKFKAGEVSLGTFSHLKSLTAIEAIGVAGLDYVAVDMEHAPIDIDEANRLFAAADAVGITPLVRINSIARNAVLSVLDIGAKGLIVPCVKSVDEVKELIEYAKFMPIGNRGFASTRDGLWGAAPCYEGGMSGYMEWANSETLLIPQCETVGCFEHIEEIAALTGVDGIMVGPYDLSIAMGHPGELGNPEVKDAIRRVLSVTHAHGKIAMVYGADVAAFKTRVAEGFDTAIIGMDVGFLISAYEDLKKAAFG